MNIEHQTPNLREVEVLPPLKNAFETQERLIQAVQHVNTQLTANFSRVDQRFDEVIDEIQKKNKRKPLKQKKTLRHALNHELLDVFLKYESPSTNAHVKVSYAKFRIVLVLLFITGARLNETKNLTIQELLDLKTTKKLLLNQSKTRTTRTVFF